MLPASGRKEGLQPVTVATAFQAVVFTRARLGQYRRPARGLDGGLALMASEYTVP